MKLAQSAVGRVPVGQPRPTTFEEYLFLAPEGLKAELHDGEMRIMSPATFEHEDIQGFLLNLLREYVAQRSLGKVIGSRYVVRMSATRGYEPDLMFIGSDRLKHITRTYLDGAPNLAIEIASADTRSYDLEEKLRAYDEGGVEEYWVIDPMNQAIHFFRRVGDSLERVEVGDELLSAVVPGFRLRLEWLWPGEKQFPTAAAVMDYLRASE